MAGYIILVNLTSEGITSVKEAPERIRQGKAAAEKMGIRTVGVWATLGQYDLMVVADAPDDKSVAAFALSMASAAKATTQTMRAFSEDELAQIVSALP
ncbi:MAG: GYD domain-containing protein [Chloroflexi bacterium]|nr:GYD domain-containing protein [Chloroflexota bacterium]MDA8216415.1 GYD domain-containing protein [Dehalococcoidales bacterium]